LLDPGQTAEALKVQFGQAMGDFAPADRYDIPGITDGT
jgi:hypothetical protein